MTLTHLGPWEIVTLLTGAFLALFDFQNLLSWRKKLVLSPLESGIADFTVVIPLFGDPRYFDHRERLQHLKERILVAIEVSSERMESFARELEGEGWTVFRAVIPAPSPPKLLLAALEADAVETTYAMRLDADSVVGHDLPNAIAAAEQDGADLCSVKVHVRNRTQNACTRFQALEYDMAMLARHYRPWLISGAGVVARTGMLREILRRHSMSPLGEDIEMGRIAFAGRLRIRHLDIVIETDAPDSWRALFHQRRLWWAGNFRHSFINFDRNAIQLPWWSLYNVSILWMTIHFHVWSYAASVLHPSMTFLALVVLLLGAAAATTLFSNWQVRTPLMIVFPLYAIVQSTLIFSVGALWYLRLVVGSGSFGRYRFGLRRRRLVLPARTIPKEWLERWSVEPRLPRVRPAPARRPAFMTVAPPLTIALAVTGLMYARRRAAR